MYGGALRADCAGLVRVANTTSAFARQPGTVSSVTRILAVGDAHGDKTFMERLVMPTAQKLDIDIVLPVGDFGYQPQQEFLFRCATAAATFGIPIWWLDGNHEHHRALREALEQLGADLSGPVDLDGLVYLPRGSRFELDGVRFCVLGGAVSVDRLARTEGVDWFPEEQITESDLMHVADGGPCDVLLTHDAPAGYVIPGIPSNDRVPPFWQPMLHVSAMHRYAVLAAVEAVKPALLVHGHYHSRYSQELVLDNGHVVQIEGLDQNRAQGALGLIEVADGQVTFSDVIYGSDHPTTFAKKTFSLAHNA